MPSYGHARYVRQAVESVIAQTWTDWELIIVDDLSPDESWEIIQGSQDSRIRAVQNAVNQGTYATLQSALGLAKGDLIAVLNSDDFWEPTKLEVQVQALADHPQATFCFVRGWTADENGRISQEDDPHGDWPVGARDYLPWLVYENRILASGVVFRREGLRFQEQARYSGDWLALLEAAQRGPGVGLSERLTAWRIHGHNTFSRSKGQVQEEIAVREAIAEHFAHRTELRSGLGRNLHSLMTLYLQTDAVSAARALVPQVLRSYPDRVGGLRRCLLCFAPDGLRKRRLVWHDSLSDLPPAPDNLL